MFTPCELIQMRIPFFSSLYFWIVVILTAPWIHCESRKMKKKKKLEHRGGNCTKLIFSFKIMVYEK